MNVGFTTTSCGVTSFGPYEVPGGTLGDRLGARVGRQPWRIGVGPVRFGVVADCLRRVTHRRERGGQHHPACAGVPSRLQHTHCALPGGDDQFVGVRGLGGRDRRSDVVDFLHSLESGRPAVVGGQIGCTSSRPASSAPSRRMAASTPASLSRERTVRAPHAHHAAALRSTACPDIRTRLSPILWSSSEHLLQSWEYFLYLQVRLGFRARVCTVAGIPERRFRP